MPLSIAQPKKSLHDAFVQDLRLAIRARTALTKDNKLGPLNLGVKMNRGTATVWGAVPDSRYFNDVRKKLLRVPGVFSVRSEMHLERFELEDGVEGPPKIGSPKPTIVLSGLPDRKRGVLNHITPHEPRISSKPSVGLRAPVALSSRNVGAAESSTNLVGVIRQAVEDVRRNDSRFHSLRWEMHDDRIVLLGPPHQGAQLMAFAQQVREIPGVQRVAIRHTQR